MIWTISSVVLTRQPNFGSKKLRNLNTSNLDRPETMTRAATFALVNWSWWGESFPFDILITSDLNVTRSDVAQFFQPSIDCIVKAVLEQKNSVNKTIPVGLYIIFFKTSFSKPSSVFSAYRACGRVCRKRLVIHQIIWNTYSPWTEHRSPWKPRVRVLQDQIDATTSIQKKKLPQKQSCFRWCDLILPRPLRENSRFQSHIWLLLPNPIRPKCTRPQITVSQGVHLCFWE